MAYDQAYGWETVDYWTEEGIGWIESDDFTLKLATNEHHSKLLIIGEIEWLLKAKKAIISVISWREYATF